MKIEVSNGELVDKYTILLIKKQKINNSEKLKNILNEINEIESHVIGLNLDQSLIEELHSINLKLWQIEDDIRLKESENDFGSSFIELARQVYKTNTLRFKAKQTINDVTNSYLKEEKSH